MWSDTLQSLERMHLLRLLMWGGMSVLTSTVLLALLTVRRIRAPLVFHFALQSLVWGAVVLAWGSAHYMNVPLREFAGASMLARRLWFGIGLDAGCVAIGATLAVCGWIWGKRLGAVGAGFGIVVQASALLLLDLLLVRAIVL
jgi:hypothetical protein